MTDGAQGPQRIFQSVRAPGRARHLEAVVSPDGTLRISGMDVSNGVLENDEFSSYEWSWIVRPAESARALAALGAEPGEDPAGTLDRWMTADARDPGMVISQAGVPIEFESRLGG